MEALPPVLQNTRKQAIGTTYETDKDRSFLRLPKALKLASLLTSPVLDIKTSPNTKNYDFDEPTVSTLDVFEPMYLNQ